MYIKKNEIIIYVFIKHIKKMTTKVEWIGDDKFVFNKYCEKMETKIQNILSRHENDILTYDILDTEKSKQNKLLSLKEKQRQMKVGEIWQEIIGNYDEFINLKTGHVSGLDILSNTRKLAIELINYFYLMHE